MKLHSYLRISKHNIFYFRRIIPAQLRDTIGKREIKVSLRTRSPRKAVILSKAIFLETERLFLNFDMGNKSKKSGTLKTSFSIILDDSGNVSKVNTDDSEQDNAAALSALGIICNKQPAPAAQPVQVPVTPSQTQTQPGQSIHRPAPANPDSVPLSDLVNAHIRRKLAKNRKRKPKGVL